MSLENESTNATRCIAAFFDVDNTIIRGASAFHLGTGLYRRGFFRTSDLARFALHLARYLAFGENVRQIQKVRSRALSIVAGHSVAEVTAVGEEVYDEVLTQRIFPGTLQILEDHIAAGHQVWLVTASPVEVADLIAFRLGATGALGTVAEQKNGIYTGRLVGDLMHGKAKADAVRALAVREGIDLAASSAYGDSANDIPLLSVVGNPCAINPDRRLRKLCRRSGWPVRDFRTRRRAARRSANAAAAAGGLWAFFIFVRVSRRYIAKRVAAKLARAAARKAQ